jgi:hypothetical protein
MSHEKVVQREFRVVQCFAGFDPTKRGTVMELRVGDQ